MKGVWLFAFSSLILFIAASRSEPSSSSPCSACAEDRTDNLQPPDKSVVVVGVLTDEGVECQAMRADDGTLYTLTGKLKNFKTGDRVEVVGAIAEFSICQQGTTIEVHRIKKAPRKV